MSFKDLADFFDPTLPLLIGGKTYTVPSPSAATGLFVQQVMGVAADVQAGNEVDDQSLQSLTLDDAEEKNLYKRLLGPVYDEFVADGLSWEHIKHAGITCIVWVMQDRDSAEAFWNTGGKPAPKARKATADRKPKKAAAKK